MLFVSGHVEAECMMNLKGQVQNLTGGQDQLTTQVVFGLHISAVQVHVTYQCRDTINTIRPSPRI